MDNSAIVKWVEENLPKYTEMLGLNDWEVTVSYKRLEDAAGTCKPHFEYQKAFITIDGDNVDDESELHRLLLHELLHIIHGPMDLFWRSVDPFLSEKESNSVDSSYLYAKELMVLNLERLLKAQKNYYESKGE